MMDRIKIIVNHLSYQDGLEYFLIAAIGLFLFTSALLFSLIMLSRVQHIARDKKREKLLPVYEGIVNAVLFENSEVNEQLKAYASVLKNKFSRSVLMEELMKLHHNFSGEYADALITIYRQSQLINDSYRKLKSGSWHIVCKGIRELSQMQVKEAYASILKHAHSRHVTLRQETQLALLQLKGFKGLEFLEGYKEQLNDWEQVNLIAAMEKMDHSDVPDFTVWLKSANTSVIIFSLRLIQHFKQVQAASYVEPFLAHPDKTIRLQAIKAVKSLQAQDYIEKLKIIYTGEEPEIKLEILDTVALLGKESDVPFLSQQLSDTDHQIRMKATQALFLVLINKGVYFTPALIEQYGLQQIIEHIADRRIDG